MGVADVASLDGAVQAWDVWMGCILCPDPAGIEEKVNLLEKGEKVLFYKRKKEEKVRYSRQANLTHTLFLDGALGHQRQ